MRKIDAFSTMLWCQSMAFVIVRNGAGGSFTSTVINPMQKLFYFLNLTPRCAVGRTTEGLPKR